MPTYYGIDPNNDPFKPKAQTTTQLASTAPLDPLNFTPDTRFFTPEQAKAVQTAQQTVKNYQSPSATTPVGDLFSGLYGTGSYQADPTQQAITDYYQTQANQVIDENKIRADKVAAIQAEVDAVNQLYARKLADVQLAGQNLTGQTNAIQARRGLAGSDFGTAQDQRVTAYNNEQNALVEAERNAKVQGLLSGARTDASAAIADARAQKEAAMQQYLSGLKTAQEDRKTRASEIALNALSLGVDLSTLTAAELKQLGKQYDIDPAQAVAQYQLALKDEQKFQADLDSAKALTDQRLNANANEKRYITLSDGTSLYDTETGQIVAENQKNFAPKSVSGASGGVAARSGASPYASDLDALTGAVVSTIPTKFGQEQFQAQMAKARNDSDSLNIIAAQVLKAAPAEVKRDFANQAIGIAQLDKAIALIDSGVQSGALQAATQYTFNLVGKDFDPKLAQLNNYLVGAIQPYRNSVTGAAWGTQEDGEYQQLFGSTKYSPQELKLRLEAAKELLKSKSSQGLNVYVNPLGYYDNPFSSGDYAEAQGGSSTNEQDPLGIL